MKFLIIIFFIICPYLVWGQVSDNLSGFGGGYISKPEFQTNIVQGNPYLYETSYPGVVYLYGNKDTLKNLRLKYHIVADLLVSFIAGGADSVILDKSAVSGFMLLKDKPQKFQRFSMPAYQFLEVLYEGQYKLLAKHIKKVRIDKPKNVTYIPDQPENTTNFKDRPHKYFLQKPNGQIQALKPSKKALISALPHSKSFLEKYFKEEKPNLNQNADWVKLIQTYEAKF